MLVRPQRGFRRLVQRRGFRRLRAAAVARVVGIFLHDKMPEHLNRCGFNNNISAQHYLQQRIKTLLVNYAVRLPTGGGRTGCGQAFVRLAFATAKVNVHDVLHRKHGNKQGL